ncbi:hypothetical protein HOY82DRAFT_572557 [Tuber indicum]|nr:hypothetical protein HOY82DRAFT_572557 [Tuber indicum]
MLVLNYRLLSRIRRCSIPWSENLKNNCPLKETHIQNQCCIMVLANKTGKASQNLTRNLLSPSHPLLFSEQRARRHTGMVKASTNKPTPQPPFPSPTSKWRMACQEHQSISRDSSGPTILRRDPGIKVVSSASIRA